jgi:hypothetical protein
MINMGIESSAKLSSFPKSISGINSKDLTPSKMNKNIAETVSNPIATEIPENKTRIVIIPITRPSERGSITYPP